MLQGYDTVFFNDETKMICGVGAGIFLYMHRVAESRSSRIRQCIPSGSNSDNGSLSMAEVSSKLQ